MPSTPAIADIGFPDPGRLVAVEIEQERGRRNAKRQAVVIAIIVHAILGLLATLAVVAHQRSEVPIVQVLAPPANNPTEDNAPTIKKSRVTDTRDTAALAPDVFTVPNVAAISLPDMDNSLSEPDLAFGSGDLGMGFGAMTGVGEGAASFFGIAGKTKSVVLVIDTSSSMPRECGPQGIAAIRKEISRVLDGLEPSSQFNIVCYGNDADRFSKRLVPVTQENRKAAEEFMVGYFGAGEWLRTRAGEYGKRRRDPEGIAYYPVFPDDLRGLERTSGGSRIELGLLTAFEMEPETIFILSDGAPSVKRRGKALSQDELLELIDKGADKAYSGPGNSVKINSVSINGLGEKFLKKIARKFDGQHRDIQPQKL